MTDPARSHGRKSIRASLRPRELITPTPEIAGAWTARVITLLPQTFPGVLGESLTGRALQDGLWALDTIDLRPFGEGRHRNVDDTPAGGGAGMVLRADVMGRAIDEAMAGTLPGWPLIYLSPRGRRFDQAMAQDLSQRPGVTLICSEAVPLHCLAIVNRNAVAEIIQDPNPPLGHSVTLICSEAVPLHSLAIVNGNTVAEIK